MNVFAVSSSFFLFNLCLTWVVVLRLTGACMSLNLPFHIASSPSPSTPRFGAPLLHPRPHRHGAPAISSQAPTRCHAIRWGVCACFCRTNLCLQQAVSISPSSTPFVLCRLRVLRLAYTRVCATVARAAGLSVITSPCNQASHSSAASQSGEECQGTALRAVLPLS